MASTREASKEDLSSGSAGGSSLDFQTPLEEFGDPSDALSFLIDSCCTGLRAAKITRIWFFWVRLRIAPFVRSFATATGVGAQNMVKDFDQFCSVG